MYRDQVRLSTEEQILLSCADRCLGPSSRSLYVKRQQRLRQKDLSGQLCQCLQSRVQQDQDLENNDMIFNEGHFPWSTNNNYNREAEETDHRDGLPVILPRLGVFSPAYPAMWAPRLCPMTWIFVGSALETLWMIKHLSNDHITTV